MPDRLVLALAAGLAAAIGLVSAAQIPGAAVLVGSYRWQETLDRFGGFSGLELSEDGQRFVAISDGGRIATGTLLREGDDERIVGVSDLQYLPLLDEAGNPLAGIWDDAEGLAVDNAGRILVSFEGKHRIWRYDVPGGKATAVTAPAFFRTLQNNSALESLALDAAGRLYTLPERSGTLSRPFPVWRLEDGAWTEAFALPRREPYLAVGADIDAEGHFYLLERTLNGIFGFQSRVRRFQLTDGGAVAETLLVESATGRHDNLEGIAVWRDRAGRRRLTMISDDNYRAFQRTEFVEYVITD